MTVDDIRNVTFESVRKGYRAEDVDDFLQQAAAEMDRLLAERGGVLQERDALIHERQSLVQAKEDAENKLFILADKVEEYRGQEETLTTALINAQRMGEMVVKEAKQKAEQMLREATGQTELLRQKAEQEIEAERGTLERLTAEVARFKSTVLNLYKQHIESLSALDPPVARAEEALATSPRKAAAGAEETQEPAEHEETVYGAAGPVLPRPAEGEAFGGVALDGE